MKKKIISGLLTVVILTGVLAVTTYGISAPLQKTLDYYETNNELIYVDELLSLAFINYTLDDDYTVSSATVNELKSNLTSDDRDIRAVSAAKLIIYAAATNTKITELYPEDIILILIECQSEDGSFGNELETAFYSILALNAVNARYDKEAASKWLTDRRDANNIGWERDGKVDIVLTAKLLTVLEPFKNYDNVSQAYIRSSDYFYKKLDSGKVILEKASENENLEADIVADDNGLSLREDPMAASWVLTCILDYGISDFTLNDKSSLFDTIVSYQNEDGSFRYSKENTAESDRELTAAALTALLASEDDMSAYLKLSEGRGFLKPDFTQDIIISVIITLVIILAATVIIILVKKNRQKNNQNSIA